MNNTKYDNVWKLLKENKFDLDSNIHSYQRCSLCNQLLINPYNAPCGCRYCFNCIRLYLDGQERFCPNSNNDCKDQMITFDRDLQIDHPMNIQISKIIVKCPDEYCDHFDELRNMENHLKSCNSNNKRCPYFKLGCNEGLFEPDQLENHLEMDNCFHNNWITCWTENIDNEIEMINHEIVQFNNQIIKINNLDEEKKKMELLKLQAIKYHTTRQTDKLRDIFQQKEYVKNQITNQVLVNKELVRSIGKVKIERYPLKKKISIDNTNYITISPHEFLWKIENFSSKLKLARYWLNTEIFSESFYTHDNGYHMRLYAYPNGFGEGKGTYFSIVFRIIQGQFDNDLQWPMKYKINIALLNQTSGEVHISQTYQYSITLNNLKYVYDKPSNNENRGYGKSKFIKLDEIIGNLSLSKNNQIFLKCSTSSIE